MKESHTIIAISTVALLLVTIVPSGAHAEGTRIDPRCSGDCPTEVPNVGTVCEEACTRTPVTAVTPGEDVDVVPEITTYELVCDRQVEPLPNSHLELVSLQPNCPPPYETTSSTPQTYGPVTAEAPEPGGESFVLITGFCTITGNLLVHGNGFTDIDQRYPCAHPE